jgi:hypothetical protein
VERAIVRVTPELRVCYRDAARRARRDRPSRLAVALIVDETRRARDIDVEATALPFLSDCVRGAVRKVRTRVAPDVGPVKASFVVDFAPLS